MATFTCCISGLKCTTSHFPLTLSESDGCMHPIFYTKQKHLFSYARKWSVAELTRDDAYLLFLALLKSTDRVHFRLSAVHTDRTDSIVANNMEKLMIVISRMNSISTPAVIFPNIVITADSRSLDSAKYWIENWEAVYEEFKKGYSFASSVKKLTVREAALEKMIKSPHRDVSTYANDLAEWAAVAGNFPSYLTNVDGVNIPLCDYWKKVIIAAAKKEYFSIPKIELLDVMEHCEDNIEPGSIHFHKLMEVLKDVKAYLEGFLGELYSPKKSNIKNRLELWNFASDAPADNNDESFDVFTQNIQAIINTAPAVEPKKSDFSSSFEYMKAKIKWSTAQAAMASIKENVPTEFNRRKEDKDSPSDGLGF